MKIKRNKNHSRRTPLLIIAGLVVVALVYVGLAYLNSWPPFHKAVEDTDSTSAVNEVDYTPPTNNQVKAGEQAKKEAETRVNEATVERDKAAGNIPESSEPQNIDVLITSANYSGGVLSLRTMISTIDGDGTCTLTLSKSGASDITQTANTQTMGSYSTCAGFDVSGLSSGRWQATVKYSGSQNRSGSYQQEVSV